MSYRSGVSSWHDSVHLVYILWYTWYQRVVLGVLKLCLMNQGAFLEFSFWLEVFAIRKYLKVNERRYYITSV